MYPDLDLVVDVHVGVVVVVDVGVVVDAASHSCPRPLQPRR
ncbi:MAG: hypothetical protein AB2L07_14280 [Thermoanaerobaculaceae bacterium]